MRQPIISFRLPQDAFNIIDQLSIRDGVTVHKYMRTIALGIANKIKPEILVPAKQIRTQEQKDRLADLFISAEAQDEAQRANHDDDDLYDIELPADDGIIVEAVQIEDDKKETTSRLSGKQDEDVEISEEREDDENTRTEESDWRIEQ